MQIYLSKPITHTIDHIESFYSDKIISQLNVNKPYNEVKIRRKAGLLDGKKLEPAFFEPLDKEELELW